MAGGVSWGGQRYRESPKAGTIHLSTGIIGAQGIHRSPIAWNTWNAGVSCDVAVSFVAGYGRCFRFLTFNIDRPWLHVLAHL